MSITRDEFISLCESSNIDIKKCLSDIDEILTSKHKCLDECSKKKISRIIKDAENVIRKEVKK